jgi:hypothetical protein
VWVREEPIGAAGDTGDARATDRTTGGRERAAGRYAR